MHHSHNPDLRTLALTWYLDESATDGSTPTAVVGGVLLDELSYITLAEEWQKLIENLNLSPGLHMKDFGQHGRFAYMESDRLAEIFSRATGIIKELAIYTVECTVEHQDHREFFSRDAKKELTAYELCFVAAAIGSKDMTHADQINSDIAFVMDNGNPYRDYVTKTYADLIKIQKSGYPLNLGSLTFADDEDVLPLQCADIICWGARRRAAGSCFRPGMESIKDLLDAANHRRVETPREALEKFSISLGKG